MAKQPWLKLSAKRPRAKTDYSDIESLAEDEDASIEITETPLPMPHFTAQVNIEQRDIPMLEKPSGETVLLLTDIVCHSTVPLQARGNWFRREGMLNEYYTELRDVPNTVENTDLISGGRKCEGQNIEKLATKENKRKLTRKEGVRAEYFPFQLDDFSTNVITEGPSTRRKGGNHTLVLRGQQESIIGGEIIAINNNSRQEQPVDPLSFSFSSPVVKVAQTHKLPPTQTEHYGELATKKQYIEVVPIQLNRTPALPMSYPWESEIQYNNSSHSPVCSLLSKFYLLPTAQQQSPSIENKSSEVLTEDIEELTPPVFPLSHSNIAYSYSKLAINTQSWHRPALSLETTINCRVLKSAPLIPDRPVPSNCPEANFSSPHELSLASGTFILTEFTEQFPLLVQNPGMASVLFRYTRGKELASYCGKLGFIENIQERPYGLLANGLEFPSLCILENNLYRAAVFCHRPKQSDFILISSAEGHFLRKVLHQYTSAQVEPKETVFTPFTKEFTEFLKERNAFLLYELFSKQPRLTVKELVQQLPVSTKTAIRKSLQEIKATLNEDGTWSVPESPSTSKLVSPEKECLYSKSVAHSKALRSKGIKSVLLKTLATGIQRVLKQHTDNDILRLTDYIEEELMVTPWELSANYVKHRPLLLQGLGDPTYGNCGYSYIRSKPIACKDRPEYLRTIENTLKKQVRQLGTPKTAHSAAPEPLNFTMPDKPSGEPTEEAALKSLNELVHSHFYRRGQRTLLKRTIKSLNFNGTVTLRTIYLKDKASIEHFLQAPPKPTKDPRKILAFRQCKPANTPKKLPAEERALRNDKRKEEKLLRKRQVRAESNEYLLKKHQGGCIFLSVGDAATTCGRCGIRGHNAANMKMCPGVNPYAPAPPPPQPRVQSRAAQSVACPEQLLFGRRARSLLCESVQSLSIEFPVLLLCQGVFSSVCSLLSYAESLQVPSLVPAVLQELAAKKLIRPLPPRVRQELRVEGDILVLPN